MRDAGYETRDEEQSRSAVLFVASDALRLISYRASRITYLQAEVPKPVNFKTRE
jgi:hypothetical protein